MNEIKKTILLVLLCMQGLVGAAQSSPSSNPAAASDSINSAKTEVDSVSHLMTAVEIAEAADSMSTRYRGEWNELSMQGKLSFTGLPMRVNVKVYMKRAEAVILSARAPFLGEVARIEINQDSIVFINKHTRTCNVQSFSGFAADRSACLRDLQDILLGEVAFVGNGRISSDLAAKSQWIRMSAGNALIYPGKDLQIEGSEYGFVMDSSCWRLLSFVMMLQNTGIVITTNYSYSDLDWTLGLEISINNKSMNGSVELSYPDYAPTPLGFTPINKYRKVDFKELMKF